MLIYLFFILLFLTVYSYFIYPFVLLLLNILFGKKIKVASEADSLPTISLIITCYNEIARVKEVAPVGRVLKNCEKRKKR